MSTATTTESLARANLELASALKAQKRHSWHSPRCAWCDAADKRLAEARERLAEIERS